MTGIGWNIGNDFPTAPPSSSVVGSGWTNNYPSAPAPQSFQPPQQQSGRPMGIGFVFDEPYAPSAPPPPSPLPQSQSQVSPSSLNHHHLDPTGNTARRSLSVNVPVRPPPPRQRTPTPNFSEVATPDRYSTNVPEKARLEMNSRPSSRSEAYERGLNDMADLMTPVELDEAEQRRIKERFALQK